MQKETVAWQFGNLLDADDFEGLRKIISENCVYEMGTGILSGPIQIAST